jgi:pimeloyl-ACP methyl ester carboxylesterase
MRLVSTLTTAACCAAIAIASAPAMAAPAVAEEPAGLARLEGDWSGQIDTGNYKLRLVLHVHSHNGATVTTLDSPDQNAKDVPVTVTVEGTRVRITPASGGAFDGDLDADAATLDGKWSGAPTHLSRLAPGAAVEAPRRPQTPVKPYPYREEEVRYPAKVPAVQLAGTLTLPQGKGPFPAVLLIAGSGPNTRDESVFGHAIFLVLADHLTRHGIAVLRSDKRGTGQSGGDYASATSEDFAADAAAAVAFLAGRPEIDASRIGLIGHSEGGIVAPLVANRDPRVRFVVLMGGPGVRGDAVIMSQVRAIGAAAGVPEAALAQGQALERRVLDAVMSAPDQNAAHDAALAILKEAGTSGAALDAQARTLASSWYRYFLAYDPAPALRSLHIPVLALIGSKDLQVLGSVNLPALRAALAANRRAEVRELEGLNHLFQTASTGAPAEYAQIEETMSPQALDVVTQWVQSVRR